MGQSGAKRFAFDFDSFRSTISPVHTAKRPITLFGKTSQQRPTTHFFSPFDRHALTIMAARNEFATCRARQLAEVELLMAMYGDDLSIELSLLEEARAYEEALPLRPASDASPAPPPPRQLRFSLTPLHEAPTVVDGEVRDAPFPCTLSCTLPAGYPQRDQPLWRIEVPRFAKHEFDYVLRTVNEAVACATGQEALVIAIESVKETVLQVCRERAEEDLQRLPETAELSAGGYSSDFVASLALSRRIGRRCVFFHHICSTAKRHCIVRWAHELRINGFVKIGYPGVLIVEGPEEGILEYISGLQGLRWKLMVVRGEETEDCPAHPGSTLDSLRRIPAHGVIEMISSSDIAAHCRECKLDELFRTSMKIYS